MELVKVFAARDDSGHWYVVPLELKEEFYRMEREAAKDDYAAYDKLQAFEEKFSKYMTGGDLNLVQLFAEY